MHRTPSPSLRWLLLAIPAIVSCRGCLETDVTFADGGSGGAAPSGTTTTSGGPSTGATTTTGAGQGGATTSTSTGQGTGGATTSTSTSTGTGGATCPQSDSFTGSALSTCWSELNANRVSGRGLNQTGHYYEVHPLADSGWWDGGNPEDVAWFLHQTVEGSFVASVHVATMAPEGTFQMAGLLVRDPDDSGGQRWLKWETGRRGDLPGEGGGGGAGGGVNFQYGSIGAANDSDMPSMWLTPEQGGEVHAINGAFVGRLGICRNGSHYMLAHRPDGAANNWVLDHDVDGNDPSDVIPVLPTQVQVGLIANAYDPQIASLEARFVEFAIDEVAVPIWDECRSALEAQNPQ